MKQPRKEVCDFNGILNGYDIKPDGTPYESTTTFNKEHYYEARRHKFKSNYYILDKLARLGYIDFLAIGVDDSSTQGVQANEITFVEGYITACLGGTDGQNPDRVVILPDADGLGHSLMSLDRFLLTIMPIQPEIVIMFSKPAIPFIIFHADRTHSERANSNFKGDETGRTGD